MGDNKSLLQGVRLLVVDDEDIVRKLVKIILADYGAAVRAVGSAAEALAAIGQWRPDVLVSDISMPHEDGYRLICQVRALDADQGGRTPALAYTALTGTETRERPCSRLPTAL
jgi:CheY-like chemotaxis protein